MRGMLGIKESFGRLFSFEKIDEKSKNKYN